MIYLPPLIFFEQWQWIKSIFIPLVVAEIYKSKGYSLMADQTEIPSREVHILKRFVTKLHPLINDQGYYIPSTAGYLRVPNSRWFCRCYSQSIETATALGAFSKQIKNRPTHWQEYLDRLTPRKQLHRQPRQNISSARLLWGFIGKLLTTSAASFDSLLLRGEQGTGKNYWMDNIMRPLLGADNFAVS